MGITNVAVQQPIGNTPFVVGVSGHRDLNPDRIAHLRDAVAAFVQDVRRYLPDTQLQILVGMADGADLIVAQTAVDLGVQVEAVLPMPLQQYAADFDADTFKRLTELLRRPDVRCIELVLPATAGEAADDAAVRDSMYSNLTATLIRRSSLLLAVWDGNASPLPAGTADTVLRYLGVRTDENKTDNVITFVDGTEEFDTAERLVYWIPAARSSGGLDTAAAARQPCFLMGAGENVLQVQQTMPTQLQRQLSGLNHYNHDYQQLTASRRLRAPDSLIEDLPPEVALRERAMLQDIDAQYSKADALAVYYQRYSDGLFGVFGVMTFTMGLAYLIYDKLTESRLLLLFYMGILLSSLAVYYLLQGKHWFAKHLTYRALAETMRAKFYLRLAGADRRVDAAEVLALSGIDRFHGFGWIGYVLKSVEPPDIGAIAGGEPEPSPPHPVEQAWIEGQHQYFTAKVARLERSSRRIKRLRNGAFVVIVLVIVALFLFGRQLRQFDLGLGLPLSNMLTFCMGFLAVMLGAWELHQDKMATRELLWQYRNQLSHFSRARLQLAHIRSPARRSDVLVALGKDSLMECYLWTIHRYHREHEPPAAT